MTSRVAKFAVSVLLGFALVVQTTMAVPGILELLIYPVIFVLWRRCSLPRETRDSMSVTETSPALRS
jgi:hypothetical protein